MDIQKAKILVSVDMITFNHEHFIAQAIEGVLMQKTNFRYELVIGEDCSKDNTPNIVKEYASKYPNLIKARCNYTNIGMTANGIKTFQECSGKYIAICEGDDYWTDPYKLQKQVDFLEANPEYGMVHTDFDQLNIESNILIKSIIRTFKPKMEWQEGKDFVRWYVGGYTKIITCTVCFRKCVFDKFVDLNDFSNPSFNKMGDIQLFCTIAGNSLVKYFDESTCIKRVLSESASNSKSYLKKIDFSIAISNAFEYYGKKFNIPETYYEGFNKQTSKKIIRTGIRKQDNSILSMGLTFKNVKYSRVQVAIYFVLFYLFKINIINRFTKNIRRLRFNYIPINSI